MGDTLSWFLAKSFELAELSNTFIFKYQEQKENKSSEAAIMASQYILKCKACAQLVMTIWRIQLRMLGMYPGNGDEMEGKPDNIRPISSLWWQDGVYTWEC